MRQNRWHSRDLPSISTGTPWDSSAEHARTWRSATRRRRRTEATDRTMWPILVGRGRDRRLGSGVVVVDDHGRDRGWRARSALVSVVATSYQLGVSTRRMEELVERVGLTRLSQSGSELAADLDGDVEVFRTRPLDADPTRSSPPTPSPQSAGRWPDSERSTIVARLEPWSPGQDPQAVVIEAEGSDTRGARAWTREVVRRRAWSRMTGGRLCECRCQLSSAATGLGASPCSTAVPEMVRPASAA